MEDTKVKSLDKLRKGIDHLESPERRKAIIPKVTPLFNTVITSAHSVYTESKIVLDKTAIMSHRQVVVAAGPNAQVKVGDWVVINVDMFPKETKPGKHDIGNKVIIHPPVEEIGGTKYLYLTDRHIKYIIDK